MSRFQRELHRRLHGPQLPNSVVPRGGRLYFIGDKAIRIDGSAALTFDNKGAAAILTAYGNLGNVTTQHHRARTPEQPGHRMTLAARTKLEDVRDRRNGWRALAHETRPPALWSEAVPNTYTGPTIVEDGWLQLNEGLTRPRPRCAAI